MENYNSFISQECIELRYRESVEWTNYWVDNANVPCERRYLLIGDSNMRMVRRVLSQKSGCPVDLFATSAALDDAMFAYQIDAFFMQTTQYNYHTIFVQLGHHGIKSKNGELYHEEADYTQFKHDFSALLHYLTQFTNRIVVMSIFDNVMPEGKMKTLLHWLHLTPEKPDMRYNIIKHRKNEIMKEVVAEEYAHDDNVRYHDILTEVSQQHFVHKDHIHYYGKTYKWIAAQMLKWV